MGQIQVLFCIEVTQKFVQGLWQAPDFQLSSPLMESAGFVLCKTVPRMTWNIIKYGICAY